MESMGIVQARTPESVKENATNILEKLGLNMSTYITVILVCCRRLKVVT